MILFFLSVQALGIHAMHTIIIWDKDGTITGSRNPNDKNTYGILPNVEQVMNQKNIVNIVCSGTKTPESEQQNFNPEKVITQLKKLMIQLPINIATFSPAIGGTQCWIIIKREQNKFEIRKAHENPRYADLIGTFKKPESGMLVVISDLLRELGYAENTNKIFIGDTDADRFAAEKVGIPFIHADQVHQNRFKLSVN